VVTKVQGETVKAGKGKKIKIKKIKNFCTGSRKKTRVYFFGLTGTLYIIVKNRYNIIRLDR
jgi:hypothetical protein